MTKKLTFIFTLLTIILLVTACSFPLKDSFSNEKEPNEKQTENKDSNTEDKNSIPATSDTNKEPTLPDVELQKGDTGENVLLLKEILIHIGYPVEKSEQYDELTTWAITDFQLQQDNIHTTGIFDAETKKALELVLEGGIEVTSGSKLSKPQGNQQTEKNIIENPFDVLALINKENALPSDYIPEDLVIPNVRFPFTEDLPQKQLRKVAAEALEKMFEAADEAGLDLFALSGYRSYDRQDAIFASNVQKHGEEAANNFSARPGESEHQSGLTMDVTTPSVNFDLVIEFGETDEGKWLKEHASEFGFIIRYLEGKEHITKYQYEPWHLRYVGVKTATEVMKKNVTLEEYFEEKNKSAQ